MNIFRKTAWQSLKNSRVRSLVTVIGVALSAAMFTAVTTFAVSLQSYLVNGAIVRHGGWHVNFPAADASFVQEQAEDSRVTDIVTFANIGYARLEGGQNPDKPYLFQAGFSQETFEALPVNLILGRLPERDDEVLVPAHVASNGGVQISVGDVLFLSVGERMCTDETLNQHVPYRSGREPGTEKENLLVTDKKVYKVVGIYKRPSFEERTAPGYTLITAADGLQRDGLQTGSFSAFVTLQNPYQARSYGEEASADGAYALNQEVMRFLGLSDSEAINGYLYAIGIILVLLIMLGSVFLIYNSFTISLNDRVHQSGILLSVGATERQLRGMAIFEGICIGLAGIPLGVLTGIPVIRLVLALVEENFRNVLYEGVPLTLTISLPALSAAALIGMVTILISAWIPAKKAARMPVMECIRQTGELKLEPKALRTSQSFGRLCGLPGILALKNFKRNKRRYRSVILSLTLSVVLFVAAGSFETALEQLTEMTMVDLDGDILFQAKDMEEGRLQEVYGNLKTADGVYKSECRPEGMLVFWSESPARSTEQMQAMLEVMGIAAGHACTLSNIYEVLEENRNIRFIVNLFSAVFLAMISLIAVANVFNTISTNIRLRRRELAMLRSVGMSDREFGRMMRFECLIYGWRTLCFGLPAALLVSWLIHWWLTGREGVQAAFPIPWKGLGISILGVFIVIFVTELYAAGRIKRENIIEALRDDVT